MSFYSRKNIRLAGYDYSQAGGYFVTVCTRGHACILSHIRNGKECESARTELTWLGQIVEKVLFQLSAQYGIAVDSYVIMPNHIHMILVIENEDNKDKITIGRFVGAMKSVVANLWLKECDRSGIVMGKLWQRNYYEHILRNELDYLEKRKYIEDNPDKWQLDDMYVAWT